MRQKPGKTIPAAAFPDDTRKTGCDCRPRSARKNGKDCNLSALAVVCAVLAAVRTASAAQQKSGSSGRREDPVFQYFRKKVNLLYGAAGRVFKKPGNEI